MTTVVLATDGSANSVAAARRLLAPGVLTPPLVVHLVHASPDIEGRPRPYFSTDLLEQWVDEAAAQAFAAILPLLLPACASVTEHRRLGDPAEVITEVAAQSGADMIVMGTHGRGALLAAVLGSVASRVVASATVPVLLVPRGAAPGGP
ncbi:universal stress protein [Cupriavidus sp. 30B13]|uniref:universal stress protein n=1 Tax=Cupriavidus sp. 30B13 TaxID=3384241 RepID=UPI003B902AB7